ncbi:MAG: trigger factor [Ezakiella sp.]|nr:trigger factor [Ezakiella sp.]MDD7472221.1 trigger factor [Bacillota bacterium]MDY3923214.1 trigger factor [Ezakiella sp.]
MKVEVVETKGSEIVFNWTLAWDDFEKYIEEAYKRTRSRYRIDGFRKGKAPRNIIENFYGKGVFYEDALNIAIDKNYDEIVKELPNEAVGMPSVDIKELEKDKEVVFEFTSEIVPEIEINKLKEIEIPKIEEEVTDEVVDAELENQRKKNQREIIVDDRAAEEGDIVRVDFEGFMDGAAFEGGKAEDSEIKLGEGRFIPGFETQIIGKNIGEEFEIKVSFPEDYHVEDYAGKEAIFKTKLNSISKYELPELDDDFASEISEFETLDEFKADIRKHLEESLEQSIRVRDENNLVEALVKETEFDVPETLVEYELNQEFEDFKYRIGQQGMDYKDFLTYTNQTEDVVKEQLKPIAEKKAKANLVLAQAAKELKIEVNDEDREKAIKDVAVSYGMEPEKFYDMAKSHDITFMDTGILNKKVIDELMKWVKRVEVKEEDKKETKSEKKEKKSNKKTEDEK